MTADPNCFVRFDFPCRFDLLPTTSLVLPCREPCGSAVEGQWLCYRWLYGPCFFMFSGFLIDMRFLLFCFRSMSCLGGDVLLPFSFLFFFFVLFLVDVLPRRGCRCWAGQLLAVAWQCGLYGADGRSLNQVS